MSGPKAEVELEIDVGTAPDLERKPVGAAPIIGVIGLAVGTINLINGTKNATITQQKFAELKGMLQQIQEGVADLQRNIEVVLSEVKWTQVVAILADDFKIIDFYFSQLTQLEDNAKAAETLVNDADIKSLILALFTIHQAMMGKMILLQAPVMKLLADKLAPLKVDQLTQSKKWLAFDYLDELIGVQAEGYAVLMNIYKAKGLDIQPLENQMRERFSQQFQLSTTIFLTAQLGYNFEIPAMGHEVFTSEYVDTNLAVAETGKVVVGLQLYAKGNRIGIEIAQATPEFDPMEEKVSPPVKWIPSSGKPGDHNYFQLNFIDSNPNILPSNMVMTGAALYLKGNRMELKIRGTPIDAKTGSFTGEPKWQENGSPKNGNYFKTEYCDSHQVFPSPLSCLQGAQLYQKGNRIGIRLYTVNVRAQNSA